MGLDALWHVGSSWTGDGSMSPALAGRFPTTGPPGKSSIFSFVHFSIVGHWSAEMAGWMAARPHGASSAESYTVSPVSIATSEIAQWCSFNHGWISGSPGSLPWDTDAGSHHLLLTQRDVCRSLQGWWHVLRSQPEWPILARPHGGCLSREAWSFPYYFLPFSSQGNWLLQVLPFSCTNASWFVWFIVLGAEGWVSCSP